MENKTRSELIKKRLFDCLQNNELNYSDEVEIVQHIAQRLNLTTPAKFAKEKGISFNGLKLRIKNKKEMIVLLNGSKLVCD